MYAEDDLLPVSALQHLAFCERQWALIHLEGVWAENRLTVEGRHFHERVDEAQTEVRGDLRVARGLKMRSLRLGLVAKADVVEFHRAPEGCTTGLDEHTAESVLLPGTPGRWMPVPVEYKRGRPKPDHCDAVQLCAQALCLEEMLQVAIPEGVIFYGKPRRRHRVLFTPAVRAQTEALCVRLHMLTVAGTTPPAEYGQKCHGCSLIERCLPKISSSRRSARSFLARALKSREE